MNTSSVARATFGVLLAIGLALLSETLAVALLYRPLFTGAWETALARNVVLPLALLYAAPMAPVLVGLGLLAGKSGERPWARQAIAAVAGVLAGVLAFAATTGRHFAFIVVRAPVVLVVAGLGAAAAFALVPTLVERIVRAPRRGALVFGALAVLAWCADAFVLPRLYPGVHGVLGAAALIAAAAVSIAWREARGPALVGGAALVLAALVGPRGMGRLETADNARLVLVEHAPWLGRAVALTMAIHPPSDDDGEDPRFPGATVSQAGAGILGGSKSPRALDWSTSDIVLLSVDALRADHVSAYGYDRPTTPAIDALAKEGALFDAAYCPTPHTSYSVTSMMTGKYMRPLLALGRGEDSETFAGHLRRYGWRTAAFYPPAVFFIDEARFAGFRDRGLDFEYRKVEFADEDLRRKQVARYLDDQPKDRPLFLWVHFFEPHEPYVAHEAHPFGDPARPRPVDAYDSEIATADAGIGAIVELVRARRPQAVFIVTADHGEEFGEHGGRYHGSSVYEEQVRVPLVVAGAGVKPGRIGAVVQTIDILPTALSALGIPRPPRVRGRDLGSLLAGTTAPEKDEGFAFAEAEDYALVARGDGRLVCERRAAACAIYRRSSDPLERRDVSAAEPTRMRELRGLLATVTREHGKYEPAVGGELPEALRRAAQGDGEAALDVAALLDDASARIREQAAIACFDLHRPETAPALRRAEQTSEDEAVRAWAALALVRVGEAPTGRAEELLASRTNETLRRRAALAFAERGDARGGPELLAWWQDEGRSAMPFERAREVLFALAKVKPRGAAPTLAQALDDVRLRPAVAEALGRLGDPVARPPLLRAFTKERYVHVRPVEARALVALGARDELAAPLARFAGLPEPFADAMVVADSAGLLVPARGGLEAAQGGDVLAGIVQVPAAPDGLRLLVRAPAGTPGLAASVAGAPPAPVVWHGDVAFLDAEGPHGGGAVALRITGGATAAWLVPRSEELPPPPKEPWSPPGHLETSGAP